MTISLTRDGTDIDGRKGDHDYSVEGRKPMTVRDFMESMDEILTAIIKA